MQRNLLAQINFTELEGITAIRFRGANPSSIISQLLPYSFIAAGILLLFYLIAGGYQIMLSGGNPKNIEAGKGKITYALIGFLVVFTAYWLIQAIGYAFGLFSITELFGNTPGPGPGPR